MMTRPLQLLRVQIRGENLDQMVETIRLIGRAIRAGSQYLPIRNLAAAWATEAPPKDYLGQANCIYRRFLQRWRYVKDPLTRELVIWVPIGEATCLVDSRVRRARLRILPPVRRRLTI